MIDDNTSIGLDSLSSCWTLAEQGQGAAGTDVKLRDLRSEREGDRIDGCQGGQPTPEPEGRSKSGTGSR